MLICRQAGLDGDDGGIDIGQLRGDQARVGVGRGDGTGGVRRGDAAEEILLAGLGLRGGLIRRRRGALDGSALASGSMTLAPGAEPLIAEGQAVLRRLGLDGEGHLLILGDAGLGDGLLGDGGGILRRQGPGEVHGVGVFQLLATLALVNELQGDIGDALRVPIVRQIHFHILQAGGIGLRVLAQVELDAVFRLEVGRQLHGIRGDQAADLRGGGRRGDRRVQRDGVAARVLQAEGTEGRGFRHGEVIDIGVFQIEFVAHVDSAVLVAVILRADEDGDDVGRTGRVVARKGNTGGIGADHANLLVAVALAGADAVLARAVPQLLAQGHLARKGLTGIIIQGVDGIIRFARFQFEVGVHGSVEVPHHGLCDIAVGGIARNGLGLRDDQRDKIAAGRALNAVGVALGIQIILPRANVRFCQRGIEIRDLFRHRAVGADAVPLPRDWHR